MVDVPGMISICAVVTFLLRAPMVARSIVTRLHQECRDSRVTFIGLTRTGLHNLAQTARLNILPFDVFVFTVCLNARRPSQAS